MRMSKLDVRRKAPHTVPAFQFEQDMVTSFSGWVVCQQFFSQVDLKGRLAGCFCHARPDKVFDRATVFFQLLVHLLLGFRVLRHNQYYKDDLLAKRILGRKVLPDVATISRVLKEADRKNVDKRQHYL